MKPRPLPKNLRTSPARIEGVRGCYIEDEYCYLLRLICRSNVEPKCGNNTFLVSPRSCVQICSTSPKIHYRLRVVIGPCSATYCEPAKQSPSPRGGALVL